VIISVSGGVADVVSKPLGVAITLFDYDVDGVENVSKDFDGEKCVIGHWDSRRKVLSNEHWPVIKQSRHDTTCRCTRR